MKSTRATGAQHEEEAARYLERRGYGIVERNFRSRRGEIDIIATEGSVLVFIEVRYRAAGGIGAAYTVNHQKQERLRRCAAAYLMRYPWSGDVRFDVVAINGNQTTLYQDAFRG
ncbi:YraN family protein [Chrysiogenes arsenatis]|uniref:YraN family protein n=1 Tax=Chrysiogenes arsenatis TaxID=309797 RepID=UPI0004225C6E|nr:YraN family protein [Chrysiogenes arsenatis]